MPKSKCVVFGGAGFIGSHLVDALINNGHEVTVFTRSRNGKHNSKARYIYGDFLNPNDIDSAIEGHEYVFHFISLTNPANSDNDPFTDVDTNIKMSIHLLQSCVSHNVKRVIYASSGGAIYGDSVKDRLTEDDITMPMSPYGIGKLTVEGYLRYFRKKHNLDYISLRISNAYGEGQRTAKGNHGVVPIFLSKIINNQEITVYGDGSMVRDYIYVKDIVDCTVSIFNKGHKYFIYNVGSSSGTSVTELLGAIEGIVGIRAKVSYVQAPDSFVARIVLDATRVHDEFGFTAKTSLSEGIKKVYAEYK